MRQKCWTNINIILSTLTLTIIIVAKHDYYYLYNTYIRIVYVHYMYLYVLYMYLYVLYMTWLLESWVTASSPESCKWLLWSHCSVQYWIVNEISESQSKFWPP